ncbi:LysR family transcriptional regulator [Paraburkholderia azotifigens]|uniref:LysR family transcriptional regulator n=1 Tax=Paraburkholderia azotifigens TaxID=2057004 RepID=A0ABU9RDT0_9BURK
MDGKPLNPNSWIRKFDLMTLRLFLSTKEEGNIQRASTRERIAASAVTRRIQELEETLGFQLLYRDPKGTTLTDAGHAVARCAETVMRAIETMRSDLSELSGTVQGNIRVWTTESVLVEFLADDIGRFIAANPAVDIELQEDQSTNIFRAVSAARADIGLCAEPSEPVPGLVTFRYRTDQLVAVMVPEHPLSTRASVSFAELLDADLIGWVDTSALMRSLEQAAISMNREFKPRYRVTSPEGARSLVHAGLGVSIQPEGMVRPQDAFASVPLNDPWATRKLSIYVQEGRQLPLAARKLIEYLSPESVV